MKKRLNGCTLQSVYFSINKLQGTPEQLHFTQQLSIYQTASNPIHPSFPKKKKKKSFPRKRMDVTAHHGFPQSPQRLSRTRATVISLKALVKLERAPNERHLVHAHTYVYRCIQTRTHIGIVSGAKPRFANGEFARP